MPYSSERGCIFYNFGNKCALSLLVAVYTLRNVYDGPVTVYLANDTAGVRLKPQLEQLDCDVVHLDQLSKCWSRHRVFQASPYNATISFDSDLIFVKPIDELWALLESEGLLVTRFFVPPYGVEGTPERPGWANRMRMLSKVRHLVDWEVYREAERRMLDERIDVNIGVMGIARPCGENFLKDFSQKMEQGVKEQIRVLDEMLTVAMLPKYNHYLAEEKWNCPADEFFRRTNLAEAHIIHYFCDGSIVQGMRIGRNPATWAGKKWYQAYFEAREVLDLAPWQRVDPLFSNRLQRLIADGPKRALELLGQRIRQKITNRRIPRSAR